MINFIKLQSCEPLSKSIFVLVIESTDIGIEDELLPNELQPQSNQAYC